MPDNTVAVPPEMGGGVVCSPVIVSDWLSRAKSCLCGIARLSLWAGLALWLFTTGVAKFEAERHFGLAKQLMAVNPGAALIENIKARDIYPYSVDIRRQIAGAFTATVASGRARVEAGSGEAVWFIARTVSPWEPGGLIAWATYLLNTGQDATEPSRRLQKVCSWCYETWVVEGFRQARAGNKKAALAALDKAEQQTRHDKQVIDNARRRIGVLK